MEENHQDKAGSKLITPENKPRLLLSEPKDEKEAQKELAQLRKRLSKNEKGAFKSTRNWTGFKGKTLWDWLQLLSALAIPIVVLSATLVFSIQQDKANKAQHDNDLKIAQDNRQNDLKIAADQQQETTLKSYLDDMADLLLNHNLRASKPGDEVRQVARERTLTVLRRLKADRNNIVVQFLQDAQLIGINDPAVNLSGAELSGDDLEGANLSYTNLSDADLSYANLSDAELLAAFLEQASLGGANLSGASLSGANLSGADLSSADLSGANLTGATMPDGSKHP